MFNEYDDVSEEFTQDICGSVSSFFEEWRRFWDVGDARYHEIQVIIKNKRTTINVPLDCFLNDDILNNFYGTKASKISYHDDKEAIEKVPEELMAFVREEYPELIV